MKQTYSGFLKSVLLLIILTIAQTKVAEKKNSEDLEMSIDKMLDTNLDNLGNFDLGDYETDSVSSGYSEDSGVSDQKAVNENLSREGSGSDTRNHNSVGSRNSSNSSSNSGNGTDVSSGSSYYNRRNSVSSRTSDGHGRNNVDSFVSNHNSNSNMNSRYNKNVRTFGTSSNHTSESQRNQSESRGQTANFNSTRADTGFIKKNNINNHARNRESNFGNNKQSGSSGHVVSSHSGGEINLTSNTDDNSDKKVLEIFKESGSLKSKEDVKNLKKMDKIEFYLKVKGIKYFF